MEPGSLPQSLRKHLSDPTPRRINGQILYEIMFDAGNKMKERTLRLIGIDEEGRFIFKNGLYGPYHVAVADIALVRRVGRR